MADDEKPPAPDPEHLQPAPGWIRVGLFVVGLGLVTAALALWFPAPHPTLSRTTEQTTTTNATRAAPTTAQRRPGLATRTTRQTKTTEVFNGRPAQRAKAEPAGGAGRRSEAIFGGLLGGGVLLLIAAGALDRLNKLTLPGGITAEFATLTPGEAKEVAASVATQAAKKGVADPEQVRTATLFAYDIKVVHKLQAARTLQAERRRGRVRELLLAREGPEEIVDQAASPDAIAALALQLAARQADDDPTRQPGN